MAVAEKRRFWLVDDDGKPTKGHVGIDGGVPGIDEGPDVKADGLIETSDPGWIAQLEANSRVTDTAPKGAKQ